MPVDCSHLPEFESVGINVFECMLVLVLDYFLEHADILGTLNVDREDTTGIIAESYAVETYVVHDSTYGRSRNNIQGLGEGCCSHQW